MKDAIARLTNIARADEPLCLVMVAAYREIYNQSRSVDERLKLITYFMKIFRTLPIQEGLHLEDFDLHDKAHEFCAKKNSEQFGGYRLHCENFVDQLKELNNLDQAMKIYIIELDGIKDEVERAAFFMSVGEAGLAPYHINFRKYLADFRSRGYAINVDVDRANQIAHMVDDSFQRSVAEQLDFESPVYASEFIALLKECKSDDEISVLLACWSFCISSFVGEEVEDTIMEQVNANGDAIISEAHRIKSFSVN